MIRSYANSATRQFAEAGKSKFSGLDGTKADRLLRVLDRVLTLSEIGSLNSIGLHVLKGDRKGQRAKGNGRSRSMVRGAFASALRTEMPMTSKSLTTTKRLKPIHPGELLAMEMEARGLSSLALALKLRVPANRISEIVNGRRGISAETALRLGRYLGTGPELWTRLQVDYDLAVAEREHGKTIRKEVQAA
jgi:antitoxin HigA-1